MQEENKILKENLILIASEAFRFQRVFEKAVSKLDIEERTKYLSQYSWFAKRVSKALENSHLRMINLEGQLYDPGMAITPLNLDDFEVDDTLIVAQMLEPVIMQDDTIVKIGTALLGRIEK